MTYQLHHGDCLDIMPLIERESVDAIVTDPPYGLGFMGKDWDHGVPGMHFWLEALRCAKPGAHLLAFGGTRTYHRLAVAIEDAGWEIRDCVMWIYGQGFPKSHDVSKAIDRGAGAEREVIGREVYRKAPTVHHGEFGNLSPTEDGKMNREWDITLPATPAAAEWDGWGTALKPAWEPIIVARKPLCGTVAENVQRYGTGAMNIDACRIGTSSTPRMNTTTHTPSHAGYQRPNKSMFNDKLEFDGQQGRWPANLIHDGSAEVLAGFPQALSAGHYRNPNRTIKLNMSNTTVHYQGSNRDIRMAGKYSGDTGSAARFFYCAKASKQDRDEGCDGLEEVLSMRYGEKEQGPLPQQTPSRPTPQHNHHPTVKPTALMRYLCRLVTPPNGVILDPFMGSGSTGKAAMLEGFNFIGIDTEIEYVEIAARRIEHACEKVGIVIEQPMMFETKREMVEQSRQLILL